VKWKRARIVRMYNSLARTSTSPVESFGFASSHRATRHTDDSNDVFAAHLFGFRVGLAGIFAIEDNLGDSSRSRNQEKVSTPKSRRRATQPINVTDLPTLLFAERRKSGALKVSEVIQHGLILPKNSGKLKNRHGERRHGDTAMFS